MRALGAAGVLLGLATAAVAQDAVIEATYLCERGVEIPVVYVTGDTPVAVLLAEGRLITLPQARSASGARYAHDGEGDSYVWWNKGDTATLAYFDGQVGEEVTLFAFCEEVGD